MRFVALVSACLLAGFGSVPAAPPSPSAGDFVEGIELAAQEQELAQGATASQFNVMQLRDLWVSVKLGKMPKTATLDLAFISPRGETFYETRLFYSRDSKIKSVRPAGGAAPASVLPARRLPGGYALDQPIPIAGSVFVRYPTPGIWTVRATVSGVEQPMTTTIELQANP